MAPAPAQRSSTRTEQKAQQQQADGDACPACHEELVPGAAFCGECGHAVGEPCPQCGADTAGCEFCEACGHWLLTGQCRFCYAEVPEGASFCTECGVDQNGLHCARCNTRGFFDFCNGCGDAVSDVAHALMQAPPDNPQLAQVLRELQAANAALEQANAAVPAVAAPPRAPSPVPAPGLNLSGALQSMREMAAQTAADQARARREAEAAREAARAALAAELAREEAELDAQAGAAVASHKVDAQARRVHQASDRIRALLELSEREVFTDAQATRRYFMALRHKLIKEGLRPGKWRCVWACVEHDYPSECGKPQLGGRWLFDE